MLVLDPRCEVSVHALDVPGDERVEELGCGLQGPQSRAVRAAGRLLRARIERMGRARALAEASRLVDWLEDRPEWRALCEPAARVAGRRRLRAEVLYPEPALVRALLHVRRGGEGFDFEVPEGAWPEVAELIARLAGTTASGPGPAPRGRRGRERGRERRRRAGPAHRVGNVRAHSDIAGPVDITGPLARELHDELAAAGWLVPAPPRRPPVAEPGLCFVGHNTVLVATRRARVLVDPWFRPWHDADPKGYRPLLPRDMGRVDAIAVTHAHGDHFHLGSLLQFPRDTPIFVPRVDRDTLLAHDLVRFLRAVGFTRARALGWGESARVGDLTLDALPFHGEQPTVGALCYPDVRNVGNTYVVRGPGVSAAFLADAGRDGLADMREVALAARRRGGKVDWVFSGCRAFALYPIFFPLSTLDAFFCNVPRELLAARQQLMNDMDDALDVAEIFGARSLVPYADGGAPWYWREGMGPAYAGYPEYPGWRPAAVEAQDDPNADPFPERLVERALQRGSPVTPRVLRPGDCVRGDRVVRFAGARWPYGTNP